MATKIDIYDLPDEEVKLVQDFVDFLKMKLSVKRLIKEEDIQWGKLAVASFAQDWDNEKDALYDNWREAYHVPDR